MECEFRPTAHARARLVERGIDRAEALDAMRRGARTRHGTKLVSRHRQLIVVWKQSPCRLRVITAMWQEE